GPAGGAWRRRYRGGPLAAAGLGRRPWPEGRAGRRRLAVAGHRPVGPHRPPHRRRPSAGGPRPTEPSMTRPPTPDPLAGRSLWAPVLWGVVSGVIQAASPLGFWWLDPATVYALSLALIAAVYIGFAVADGRPTVIAAESDIAAVFVVVAAAGVTGPAWLLVAGLAGHG